MQSLLRWSIENSTTNTPGSDVAASPPQATTRRTELDPGVIDAILGRPDSELMKEALAKAQDASLDEDARLMGLDDLEMVKFTFNFNPHPTPAPLRTTVVFVSLLSF
jgi:hsp70-interacting protein